jgi:hypothetical protein
MFPAGRNIFKGCDADGPKRNSGVPIASNEHLLVSCTEQTLSPIVPISKNCVVSISYSIPTWLEKVLSHFTINIPAYGITQIKYSLPSINRKHLSHSIGSKFLTEFGQNGMS